MSDTPETVTEVLTEEAPAAEIRQKEAPSVEVQPAKAKKEKKARKPRSVPVKILMGLIAFILCVVMFVISLVGILILDVRAVVSRNGISQIVSQLISGQVFSGPARPALAAGVGGGTVYMDDFSAGGNMSGMLVDWAYDMLKDQFGDELPITKEQVQTFVEESTVQDFVADKVAGIVEDFYSGKSETTITVEEITQLIEENKEIIEEQFDIEITEEALDAVDTMLEESGILEPIEEQGLVDFIKENMENSVTPEAPDMQGPNGVGGLPGNPDNPEIPGTPGTPGNPGNTIGSVNPMDSINQVMELVRTATSYTTVAILGGIFALLLVLLFFVTGRSFPATLADTGVVLLLAGLIFAAPTAVCVFNPQLVSDLAGPGIGGIVCLIFNAAATVNFTVVGVGFALIVAAIVVKIVLSVKAKKQA